MTGDFDLVDGVSVGGFELVWVEGAEAVSFLDGQVTQDVAGMPAGSVARSLLLEPRGKLRAVLWLLRGPDRVGLVTPAGTGDAVVAALEQFRFRVAATLRRDPRPVHGVWGGEPGRPAWEERQGVLTAYLPGAAPRRLVASAVPPPGRALTAQQVDAHRVAAGQPWFGRDLDGSVIPQETGLVAESVSLTKGCYVGQELVARIESRGHVNRTLRRVVMAGFVPPSGAEVTGPAGAVGTLGTVAPTDTGAAALALLRREVAPRSPVGVRWPGGSGDAVVEEIASQTSNSRPA